MKQIATALRLAALLLIAPAAIVPAGRAMAAPAGQLYLVSPFLLGASDLSTIDLAQVLPTIPSWSAVAAEGLELDYTSAAIAVWQTSTPADVTFTVDNGATLAAYADNFLTTAPSAGSASLTVPAAGFIAIGGSYYAAALVEAPAAGAAVSSTTPIAVTAAVGGAAQATASLAPVAPPVVLVHGMWGDATSLADLHNYLDKTAPWSGHPELVQAIAYTNFLSFDDAEPAAVLNSQILTLFGSLDDEHIVGGRVDVVAHSMGGLVARHYSALAAYRGLRDRGQGKFREIVTLDTPETGSELAQYLLQNRHDTLQPFASATAQAIWLAACGSPLPTVAQCFATLGMRLGPRHLRRGAVFSLVPSHAAVQQLPSPDIPDAAWRAFTAIVPQVDGLIGESAEEFELQQLIAATWPDPNANPPTIADILADNRQDDALVPLSSQMAGAAAGQYTTLKGLAHSPAADASILGLLLSNANVTQSSAVNAVVACWLAEGGAASCIPQVPQAAALSVAAPPFAIKKLHPVRRLVVAQPQDLRLTAPFELALRVPAPGLLRLVMRQHDGAGHSAPPQTLTVDQRLGDTVYATATPDLFGQVTFTVDALFSDGGLSSQAVTAPVALPDRPPTWLRADANAPRLRIGLAPGLNLYELHPQALYPGSTKPVALDSRIVRYRIVKGSGVVALASNPDDASVTEIVGLAAGKAQLEASLGAATAGLDIIVERQ